MILDHNDAGTAQTETYTCSHCHADINIANQVPHEAHCSRTHRTRQIYPTFEDANTRNNVNIREQRQQQPQLAQRQNSSSGNLYQEEVPDILRQPQIRRREAREERKLPENKMMACPNCEKGIREQDLTAHMNYECESNDKIPCEFCNVAFPMNQYADHVENCSTRRQEQPQNLQQNARPRSPGRDHSRAQQRQQQQQRPSSLEEPHTQHQRPLSPRRGASQDQQQPGGFMTFLSNLGNAAANALKGYVHHEGTGTDLEQRQQQQEQQRRAERMEVEEEHQPGFFERVFGGHHAGEERRTSNRNTIPQRPMERRQDMMRDPFFEMFNPYRDTREHIERHRSPMNQQVPNPQRGQQTIVRTIERGPHGTLIMRTRVVPANRMQNMQQSQMQMARNMEDMGPLAMLLGLLNNNGGGMPVFFNQEGMPQEEQRGLNQQTLDDLAVVKFDKEKFKNLDAEERSCPICLDEFQDGDELKFLWCLHRFHKNCVDKWLEKSTSCPVCKKDFSEAENFGESENSN